MDDGGLPPWLWKIRKPPPNAQCRCCLRLQQRHHPSFGVWQPLVVQLSDGLHLATRAKFETGEKENFGNLMASISHNLWRKKTTCFFLELFLFYHFIQYRGRKKSPYGSSSWFQPSHIASEPACETAILKRYCKTSEVQRLQVHSVGGMFGYWEFLEMGIPQVTRLSILNRSNDLDALEYLHDLGTPPMENDMLLPEKQRLRYNATTSCPVVLPRKSGKASTERGSFQHVMLSWIYQKNSKAI